MMYNLYKGICLKRINVLLSSIVSDKLSRELFYHIKNDSLLFLLARKLLWHSLRCIFWIPHHSFSFTSTDSSQRRLKVYDTIICISHSEIIISDFCVWHWFAMFLFTSGGKFSSYDPHANRIPLGNARFPFPYGNTYWKRFPRELRCWCYFALYCQTDTQAFFPPTLLQSTINFSEIIDCISFSHSDCPSVNLSKNSEIQTDNPTLME